MPHTSIHRVKADGVEVFYREAGPAHTPVVILLQRSRTSDSISAYLQTAGAVRQYVQGMPDESIAGDPDRAASAILNALDENKTIRRPVRGTDAFTGIMGKLTTLQQEYAASEAVARSTDFGFADPVSASVSLQ